MIPVRSLTYEGHRLSEALWVFAEFFSECLLLLAQLEHFILLTLLSLLFLQSFDLWFPAQKKHVGSLSLALQYRELAM